MPIYEYECGGCGHRLEEIQKVSDDPLTDCPSCGQSRLRRLVSAAGFQLKGTGWYVTDFKNSGRKNGSSKGGDGEKSSSSEGDGGSKAHACGGGACGCAH
ncbi:MAG TPA: FmdB family zinc ribbon protein [Burkholderiales bacterium]